MRKKWIIAIVVIVIVVAGGTYLYTDSRSGEATETGVRFKEFTVERGDFLTMVSASGVVIPIDRVEIKSKASGRIDNIPVEEGDFVEKGELVCRLDQTDVQAEVDQAKADLEIAEAELKQAQNSFERQQKLYDKGLISEEAYDQAALALAQAKGKMVRARISLDQANTSLNETVVRAPIDGVILQKYVEEGQIISSGISNVSGGSPIADIASMKNVYVEAGIDEIDVGKINIGQTAEVVAEAYPRMTFRGEIIRIAPEAKVEQNVTLFDVIIEVENKDGKLKSGMNATAEITIASQKDVLLVPTTALTPAEGGPGGGNMRRTFLKKGDEFVPHMIRVGMLNFGEAVVLEGLDENDIIGVPMVSRLKADNERLEQRIKSSRSFGASDSSSSSRRGD